MQETTRENQICGKLGNVGVRIFGVGTNLREIWKQMRGYLVCFSQENEEEE